MSATDQNYECVTTTDIAGRILGASIEQGDSDGSSWAIHIGGRTLFINSESPIEFAVPREATA